MPFTRAPAKVTQQRWSACWPAARQLSTPATRRAARRCTGRATAVACRCCPRHSSSSASICEPWLPAEHLAGLGRCWMFW